MNAENIYLQLIALANDHASRASRYDDGHGGGELHCYLGGKAQAFTDAAELVAGLL